jgi:hypothetical protein
VAADARAIRLDVTDQASIAAALDEVRAVFETNVFGGVARDGQIGVLREGVETAVVSLTVACAQ